MFKFFNKVNSNTKRRDQQRREAIQAQKFARLVDANFGQTLDVAIPQELFVIKERYITR